MGELAEQRADAGDLEHQPLHDVISLRHVGRPESSGLLAEIHQDRAGLEHGIGLAARAIAVDDHGNFRVRIDLDEIGSVLLALPHIDEMLLVGQLGLLEHNVDLLHVRAGQRIKVDHGNVLKLWGEAAKLSGPAASGKVGSAVPMYGVSLVRDEPCRVGLALRIKTLVSKKN